jgi:hypothetical protein
VLHRSPLVQVWSGVTSLSGDRAQVAVTWEPGTGPAGFGRSPAARVMVRATTPDGKVLYDGPLSAVRSGENGAGHRALFDAPVGRVQLDITVLGISGQRLDTDVRDVEIQTPKGAMPLLLPPVLLSTQSAREFREAASSPDASPAAARAFRRTEHLIVRVPAYSADGPAQVSVRLLNRVGQSMKELERLPDAGGSGVPQFDLPLAPLAPGEYFLLLSVPGPTGPIAQRVPLKITG